MKAYNRKRKPKHTTRSKWKDTWCNTKVLWVRRTKSRLRYYKSGYYWKTQKFKRYRWKIVQVQNKYKKHRRKNDK